MKKVIETLSQYEVDLSKDRISLPLAIREVIHEQVVKSGLKSMNLEELLSIINHTILTNASLSVDECINCVMNKGPIVVRDNKKNLLVKTTDLDSYGVLINNAD